MTVALATVAGGAMSAAADPDTPAAEVLETANRHYQALDYEQAIAAAGELTGRDGLDDEQRIDALLVTALAHLALVDPDDPVGVDSASHQDAAEAALRGVLEMAWDFELDRSYPASAHAAFATARDTFERDRARAALARCAEPPVLALDAPLRPRGGRGFDVTIRLGDPQRCTHTVRLTWARDRVTTSSLNRLLLPVTDGVVIWRVPPEVTTSTTGLTLALYAEAFDQDHGRLAVLGSFEQPHRIEVAAGAPPPPLYRRWWFWSAIGVAAIGTALLVDHALDAGPSTVVFRP